MLFPSPAYSGSVAVIGAGVAGLHAALILKQHGVNAQIFEADRRIGGRIKTQALGTANNISDSELLVNQPIEIGADFIYGQHNSLYDLARNFTEAIKEVPQIQQYGITGSLSDVSALETSPVYGLYTQIRAELLNYDGPDKTIDDYVIEQRLAAEQLLEQSSKISILRNNYRQIIAVLNATISSEYGLLTSDLAIYEYQSKAKIRQEDQHTYRLPKDPFLHMLRSLYNDTLNDIVYRQKITAIDYNETKIVLSIDGNKPVTVDKVIVTVPVDVLREINFSPGLPEPKQQALNNIKMSGAFKAFLRFNQRFWNNDLGKLFLPYPYSFLMPHPSTDHHILVLYSFGNESEGLTSLGAEALQLTLDLLDKIFGQQIASSSLRDYRFFNWNKRLSESPFIPGAYSYVEEGFPEARAALAAPIDNKIYFAGEATHAHGLASSISGALETGLRAAHELLNSA